MSKTTFKSLNSPVAFTSVKDIPNDSFFIATCDGSVGNVLFYKTYYYPETTDDGSVAATPCVVSLNTGTVYELEEYDNIFDGNTFFIKQLEQIETTETAKVGTGFKLKAGNFVSFSCEGHYVLYCICTNRSGELYFIAIDSIPYNEDKGIMFYPSLIFWYS